MATIVDLFIYPLKSGRGIAKPSVRIAPTGFEWDRHWMLVDAAGTFITQRTHPKLARLVPSFGSDSLALDAPGLPTLRVPLAPSGDEVPVTIFSYDCMALDQGDAPAEWASDALGDSVRLVRVAPSMPRVANPKYAGSTPAPVAFADGYPVLVCNEASLAHLNERMPTPVPMERFRPNLVLSGLPPFAEDRIESLRMGDITLRLVKPCTRCVIPSTDQQTGERSTNPLPVLRTYRFDKALRGITFGENAVIAAGIGNMLTRGSECSITLEASDVAWREGPFS
jgi:uncharacterized protein YcbX